MAMERDARVRRAREDGKAEMSVCVSVFVCLRFSLSCKDGTNVRDRV
jgi:hypothetical protein